MRRRSGRHSECIQALPTRKCAGRSGYHWKSMTEREFDLPSTPARFGAGRIRLAPLPARTVWASAAALLGGMVVHSWSIDGDAGDVLFVSGAVLTLGALVLLVSRRLLVATVLVAAIITLLRTVAVLKQEPTGVVLHAYDV